MVWKVPVAVVACITLAGCFGQSDENLFVAKCTEAGDLERTCRCAYQTARAEMPKSDFELMMSVVSGDTERARKTGQKAGGLVNKIGGAFRTLETWSRVKRHCGLQLYRPS